MPSSARCLQLTLGAIAAALLGAGCYSTLNIQADAQTKSQIKRIALVEVPDPVGVQVDNFDSVGSPYMVVTPLVGGSGADAQALAQSQATPTDDHSTQFAAAIKPLKPGLGVAIQSALAESLKANGFEIAVQPAPKHASRKAEEPATVAADALLRIECSVVGYMASFYSGTYEPWVVVNATLLEPKAKRTLYARTFCVGYRMKDKNAVFLPADQKFRYGSFAELLKKVGDAYQGLVKCGQLAARQIGDDLKP